MFCIYTDMNVLYESIQGPTMNKSFIIHTSELIIIYIFNKILFP